MNNLHTLVLEMWPAPGWYWPGTGRVAHYFPESLGPSIETVNIDWRNRVEAAERPTQWQYLFLKGNARPRILCGSRVATGGSLIYKDYPGWRVGSKCKRCTEKFDRLARG